MFIGKRLFNQKGDTIVEVLIAIAVVTTILGGAYASSRNSLSATRQSQEREEALKLVEGQIETLQRSANTSSNSLIFTTPNVFCMNSSGQPVDATYPTSSTVIQPASNDILDNYIAPCKNLGLGNLYNVAIERSGANLFTAYARWDRAGGRGREELKLVIRVY